MYFRCVVIAGLGDSGVLTAIRLARHAEVVGVSTKPALVSGQELGWRLSRPHDWARANWIPFDKFRGLDRVRTVHGTLTGLAFARTVVVRHDDGSTSAEGYDALIISTGVTNGFWRPPNLESAAEMVPTFAPPTTVSPSRSVIVVGGGAAAVSSAANVARTWPRRGSICTSRRSRARRPSPPRVEARQAPARRGGGGATPRASRGDTDGFDCDQITGEPVQWSTGQPPRRPTPCSGRSDGCDRTPTGCLRSCSTKTASSVFSGTTRSWLPECVRGRRRRGERSALKLGP